MKFPSLNFLISQGITSFKKFSFTILSAAFAVGIALYLVEFEPKNESLTLINLLLCGYLGVPLFLTANIQASLSSNSNKKWLLSLAALVIIGLVYFSLPGYEDSPNVSISYIRYTTFAVAAHLLVSFTGFIKAGSVAAFWEYNKSLFLRFLLSALYSVVLYLGLILALFAVDTLFGLDIDGKRYFQIFIFITGVFNTWFFVAGIPSRLNNDYELSSVKGLKTFILYVLLPLIALYFLILYSYSAKVVMLWDWPKGILTYMLIAMAVVGILTVLLSYPFASSEKNPISFLSKRYYLILLPLLIMLFLAIGIRIDEYGVTINRYITVLLAIWLLIVSVYFVLFGRNIKFVPITLFVIILLTSFGPWGIFSVSEKSQVSRLVTILEEADLMDGKIKNEPKWVSSDTTKLLLEGSRQNEGFLTDSLHNEVKSILDYLEDYHGFTKIDHLFEQNPREIAEEHHLSEASAYMQMMGLKYYHIYRNNNNSTMAHYSSTTNRSSLNKVAGYDYSIWVNQWMGNGSSPSRDLDKIRNFRHHTTHGSITLVADEKENVFIDLNEKFQLLKGQNELTNYNLSDQEMTISFESDWVSGEVLFYSISGTDSVENFEGNLLFRLKD